MQRTGRNKELAKALRDRPQGKHDPRPRKQRTRKGADRHAIKASVEGWA